MSSNTGFKSIPRKTAEKKPPAVRVKDYYEFHIEQPDEVIEAQASRCMDCGVPFCHYACPLGNALPDVNELVKTGNWKKALDILHSTNNFPEFTGRLCPALCEAACTLGLIKEPTANREIELAVIERGFREGWVQPLLPRTRSGRKVAVVGSGPSGLACAQQLARAGHSVTVLERDERIGGILALGIPDYKLEKAVLDRRLAQLTAEGIQFRTGVYVGRDMKTEELLASYDAVCLAAGATVPRDLDVKGRKLKGIEFAMDFLTQQNRILQGETIPEEERISAAGKNVVIIGGGDTGADCLGISLRQGAKSVIQVEMMPEPPKDRDPNTPWPEWPKILRTNTAHEEGGTRMFSVGTRYFAGKDGVLNRIRCNKLSWTEGARPVWAEIPGSEFDLEADLVLLAMGFLHPEQEVLLNGLGVKLDARGNVATDETGQTSLPGVFAAGDVHTGQSLVCRAISDGRKAAEAIDAWLNATHMKVGNA